VALTIPLKGSTAGVQYAGWEPRRVAAEGLGNAVHAGQRVPMADGVTLNADVYTPAVPGRYPAVVCFAGYATDRHTAGLPVGTNEIGSPPVFTDRGYCHVVVERRGMGRSAGEQVMFFDDRDVDDHEEVIAWAAAQPWCNGDVVLFGTSYYATTQPQVAARKPPALRAFFANELSTDLERHLVHYGGVPASFFIGLWMGANFTRRNYSERIAPPVRALLSHLTNGPAHPLLEKLVHRNVTRAFNAFIAATPVPWARDVYARWMFDEKTREQASIPAGSTAHLGDVDVPFVVKHNLGYWNVHQFGAFDLYENAATPAGQKWLILGPAEYDLPVYGWQGEALAFFDHVLHGTDNGYADQAPVRYWLESRERFASADAFPPGKGTVRRLHLGADGLDPAPTPQGSRSWVAVPRGVPVVGGLDEVADQVIAFDLAVTEALHLAGPVTAHLTFASNEIDSYVVARLARIDAAGAMHRLSMGAVRPVARSIDLARSTAVELVVDHGRREPLTPGEPVELRFSLTPGPTVLAPGEVLRLELASRSDLLRGDLRDGYCQVDLPVPPYLCRNTVHFGGRSWIEVTEVSATGTGDVG
jgi:uncharacterized protein